MEQKCNECEHCAIGHWKQIPSKVEVEMLFVENSHKF